MNQPAAAAAAWPALPLADWQDTAETLQLWTQMVGKTRLALSPPLNHWWHVALYVTPRGLGTSAIPDGARTFDVELDFLAHELVLRTSDGKKDRLPLRPRAVADFYREYRALLRNAGIDVKMWPVPAETVEATPFLEDRAHAAYDADAAQRFWRALVQAQRVLEQFRGSFLGKCSPAHFWWGGFDLACTRFSGRPAPVHPGGIPHLADWVTREAYSHECISAGWWPGNRQGPVTEPAFYAYAYPEPSGCPQAAIAPAAAHYHPALHEWILPYEAVRTAADPQAELRAFLESTYAVAASLGGWDPALVRTNPK